MFMSLFSITKPTLREVMNHPRGPTWLATKSIFSAICCSAVRSASPLPHVHARAREKLKENFRRMELFGSEFGEPRLRFSWVISPPQEAAGATVAIARGSVAPLKGAL
jgi:hypothetical protein